MNILEIDNKNESVSVRIEDLNDLWTLFNVIDKNDKVSARTSRRIVLKEGSKGERKPMTLKLNVESVSFHEFTNRLRVKGTIIEEQDDSLIIASSFDKISQKSETASDYQPFLLAFDIEVDYQEGETIHELILEKKRRITAISMA